MNMKKMSQRIIALFATLVMISGVCAASVSAATTTTKQKYNNYVILSDSTESGWGLPQYQNYWKYVEKRKVICFRNIQKSAPWWVARATGANLKQYAMPGARTTELLYLLTGKGSYGGEVDYILKEIMPELSEGSISTERLDRMRPIVIQSIKKADLITISIGLNDCWVPIMASIYSAANDSGFTQNMTIPQYVDTHGGIKAIYYDFGRCLNTIVSNSDKREKFTSQFMSGMAKWLSEYQVNMKLICDAIYELNPNATLLIDGSYNPVNGWSITSAQDKLIQWCLNPYYEHLNIYKRAIAVSYKGNAKFVSQMGVELFSTQLIDEQGFHIPLFETMSVDNTGYNPHPTEKGCAQQAINELNALGVAIPVDLKRANGEPETSSVRSYYLNWARRVTSLLNQGKIKY